VASRYLATIVPGIRPRLLIFRETGKPVAHVARDLGINEGTLGN